jgi:hypothetical protein
MYELERIQMEAVMVYSGEPSWHFFGTGNRISAEKGPPKTKVLTTSPWHLVQIYVNFFAETPLLSDYAKSNCMHSPMHESRHRGEQIMLHTHQCWAETLIYCWHKGWSSVLASDLTDPSAQCGWHLCAHTPLQLVLSPRFHPSLPPGPRSHSLVS